LGYALAGALLPDVAATIRGLYGAPMAGDLAFRPTWALSGLAIAGLGTAAAAAAGVWSIVRMPLLAPAQPRAWARASASGLRRQALAGIALILGGIACAALLDGLIAGFALLGGLLLGAALTLPICLSTALALGARRSKGVLAQWFWADASQQLRGLSLALMALMLALATNVGVGTMVSSFRLTFTGWLDQRLAADLYLSTRSEVQSAQLVAWATANDARLLPITSVEADLAGRPGDIFGVVDDPLYRDTWPMLSGLAKPWDALQTDDAVLVNEQLARGVGLSPGDSLSLGPGWSATIAGIYSDYGNPEAQAIVALSALDARHPGLPRLRFGLITDDIQAARDSLALLGISGEQITDQAALKAFSLSIFEQTFTVTTALNVLTLGVAGFAIFTSLTTLAGLRLPQLAPVWALGLPRARLAWLDLLRALLLAALTFVLALPVGLALAWALLAVVNVEAFGWRLPMFLFPGQWLWLAAAALLAAGLAAALPARALARRSPAEFLKVFANER
jgi:putative ABC transport system permease protein